MLSVSTNQYVDAWILDSGYSYHITPNREWFSSYRSGNSGSVYLGDDDAATLKVWVYFLKQKSEVFAKFKLWKAEVENQIERMNKSLTERARCLRLNAGLPKSFWAEAMELELHPVAIENHGRSHPTSSDPVATESDGSSTTNELQSYNLARDRQRRTNVKPPSRLGYEDMVSFALLVSGDEPTTFH
ncbi:hypothetical protein Sango_1188900 [Sesamum angolense]|uniref:Retrovirus-related Pol polyprotein from transposon TNT 1-94-like beta-barrel domain-containing protein n=1 Tax=Sesamum angolense TaxID=2727404 RepID=A0AAE1WWY7_9LAMI|nr:hypothetical protein Sango_1188900 [Sesamum angolense]